jgi:hypothetical protein
MNEMKQKDLEKQQQSEESKEGKDLVPIRPLTKE